MSGRADILDRPNGNESQGGATDDGRGWRDVISSHPASTYYVMLGSTVLLLVVGVVMVWSASAITNISDTGSSFATVSKQAMFAVGGVMVMLLASRVPSAWIRRLSLVALLIALALLVAVLIPGIGISVAGQQNWIGLGGSFRLQPSEVAKFALVVWGAATLARWRRPRMPWKRMLIPLIPITVLILVLVYLEGDFGNTMILAVIAAGLLFAAGAPIRLFVGLGAVAGLAVVRAIQDGPYRVERWKAFLDPNPDPSNEGWQVIQGMNALGTGGWSGVGLGASREKWGGLPAAHTDFILPVIGEELGLLGTLGVLTLFGALVWSIMRLAMTAPDTFTRLLAAGTGVWVMIQVITNVGATLKMLPITGVTLPMVSYGGSSLIPLLLAIGLLLGAASRLQKQAA